MQLPRQHVTAWMIVGGHKRLLMRARLAAVNLPQTVPDTATLGRHS